jgi:hypothetical protein
MRHSRDAGEPLTIKGQFGLLNACNLRGIYTRPGQDKADRIRMITDLPWHELIGNPLIENYCRDDVMDTVTLFGAWPSPGRLTGPMRCSAAATPMPWL